VSTEPDTEVNLELLEDLTTTLRTALALVNEALPLDVELTDHRATLREIAFEKTLEILLRDRYG
jgi:hypothetical protein